jgi:hypothetical protein
MSITPAQLREVFEVLIRHLEETGVSEIEIDPDYYWDIPAEELYDPYNTPEGLDLGQLTEDWQKLQDVAAGRMPPVGYGLTWLAAVLRAVGEKTPA